MGIARPINTFQLQQVQEGTVDEPSLIDTTDPNARRDGRIEDFFLYVDEFLNTFPSDKEVYDVLAKISLGQRRMLAARYFLTENIRRQVHSMLVEGKRKYPTHCFLWARDVIEQNPAIDYQQIDDPVGSMCVKLILLGREHHLDCASYLFDPRPLASDSHSDLESHSEGVSEGALGSLTDSLSEGISESDLLSDPLSDSLSDWISNSLSDSILDSISDSLSDSISDSLSDSLLDSLSDSFMDSLSDSISDPLSDSDSDLDLHSEGVSEGALDPLTDPLFELELLLMI